MKSFSQSHEWVFLQNNKARVGISIFARGELGEILFVSFPSIGQKIKKDEEVVVLESSKAASGIYSPLSGMITQVNTKLFNNINILNEDPEDGGWLYEMELSREEELQELMGYNDYLSFTKH